MVYVTLDLTILAEKGDSMVGDVQLGRKKRAGAADGDVRVIA